MRNRHVSQTHGDKSVNFIYLFIFLKVSTLIGVRHRGRAPQVRAYNQASQLLPPRPSEEAGVGACVCRLRVGDICLMDRLVLGEDTEVCSFLLHWSSQLSPSCLGENWKGTIRKADALQNFQEVKFLFCGAGRGREWPPLAITPFEKYLGRKKWCNWFFHMT